MATTMSGRLYKNHWTNAVWVTLTCISYMDLSVDLELGRKAGKLYVMHRRTAS